MGVEQGSLLESNFIAEDASLGEVGPERVGSVSVAGDYEAVYYRGAFPQMRGSEVVHGETGLETVRLEPTLSLKTSLIRERMPLAPEFSEPEVPEPRNPILQFPEHAIVKPIEDVSDVGEVVMFDVSAVAGDR